MSCIVVAARFSVPPPQKNQIKNPSRVLVIITDATLFFFGSFSDIAFPAFHSTTLTVFFGADPCRLVRIMLTYSCERDQQAGLAGPHPGQVEGRSGGSAGLVSDRKKRRLG